MNIHDRQAAAHSCYDYGVVHKKYVATWTANQIGLVTLTFDLLTLKVVSESRATWLPLRLLRPLCSRVMARCTWQTSDTQTSDKSIA